MSRSETETARPIAWPLAYAQLVRLPNVFTAIADVAAGFLFTHLVFMRGDGLALGFLIAASCLLYMAGMVLNDVFDYEVDCNERPERPLPSGRISRGRAKGLGWQLLIGGLICAWLVTLLKDDFRPGLISIALAACVVAYDAWLKRTPLGPIAMGACRMLNVLLGMSLVDGPWQTSHLLAAAAIGVYILGVTRFARTEAKRSNRMQLALAAVITLSGVGMLVWLPSHVEDIVRLLQMEPERWPTLLCLLGLMIGYRMFWAVADPVPYRVQWAVKASLLSLIFLDAAICFVTQGLMGAVVILLLLIPAIVIGRWVYST